MQPRLTRSRTDKIIAGVCGGLGEYFAIDPVIVRLIFVLVTLTSGMGLPIYIVLWILMPRTTAPVAASPQPDQQPYYQSNLAGSQTSSRPGEAAVLEEREVTSARSRQPVHAQRKAQGGMSRHAAPFADAYSFDPQTGQPVQADRPVTGETVKLQSYPASAQMPPDALPPDQQPYGSPRRRNWRTLGFILVGIGALVLLEQFNIATALVFPVLLIVAGIILLKRR